MERTKRIEALKNALARRVLVLDGAMGTAIQALDPSEADFGGSSYSGCNENLVLSAPHIIEEIHRQYLEAGADIIETDTFGGTPIVLGEFGLSDKAHELNRVAAQLARKWADTYWTAEKPRFVAGSIGPTTKAISVTGGITLEELTHEFYLQALALHEGGVDYFLMETCQDTRNVKAGLLALQKLFEEGKEKIPIAISCTIEPMGTMLAGQTIDAFAASVEHMDLLYLGLNCATGPEFMTDHLRTLSSICQTRVACVPNAGLPDENGIYLETPAMMAKVLREFGEHGWLNLLGGCCGTTPEYIKVFSDLAQSLTPRTPVDYSVSTLSGIEFLEVTDEKRPLLVGERTNVIGSRKFKRLICEGAFEEAAEIARAQVKKGAHIIDICMANPDRDELSDIDQFMQKVMNKVKVPFMIDSTDSEVMERALTYCQGKALINSVNLEDGEERFEKIVPLAKKYGAALVVGCIDEDPEQGMGVTRQRKLAIARRSYQILTGKYGMAAQNLYFDPLVFPCATGDKQYLGSAPETIEGVRLIKQAFPLSKTVLGISNVSFGLPPAGREILNSVFLYHCTKAGLDLAIVNSEKLERYAGISAKEKTLAENLLWNKSSEAISQFTEAFRKAKPKQKKSSNVPLEERLALYIVEGSKDGLVEDLDLALKKMKPLHIINGPLMDGMNEVGRLFNNNELIVAEVLQSAESMKAAVSYLEPFMEKTEEVEACRVLLATVKGDVHDIGKNLVEIIFNNNGFEVINLGIKIPPEQIIAAIKEHKPHILGLSGLLVKSAQQMVITAEDVQHAKIDVPILVGGAALTRNFVDRKIAAVYPGFVEYAQDAMHGLELAKQIVHPETYSKLQETVKDRREDLKSQTGSEAISTPKPKGNRIAIAPAREIPQPADFHHHVLSRISLDQVWSYINPLMLYGKHLGVRGSVVKRLMKGEKDDRDTSLKKAWEIYQVVQELKEDCRNGAMKARGVYRFFKASSSGNKIKIYKPVAHGFSAITFDFPRQQEENGWCLADFVASEKSGDFCDNLCLFVVTAGDGIVEKSREFKDAGQYLKSHAFQALAMETAEAFAEYLHAKIRGLWGFADSTQMTMMERFQAKYRGCRYSFGYPACPELKDQEKLFEALNPQAIGVSLTENHMMEPEASVSAIVFHHEQAKYFGVGEISPAGVGRGLR